MLPENQGGEVRCLIISEASRYSSVLSKDKGKRGVDANYQLCESLGKLFSVIYISIIYITFDL